MTSRSAGLMLCTLAAAPPDSKLPDPTPPGTGPLPQANPADHPQ